jgi:copper chaperone CopZ
MKTLIAILASAALLVTPTASAQRHAASAAAVSTTTLHIEGMTCGSCATAVKHVLKEVDGVSDASVSYKEKQAVVTYNPKIVTPEQIARSVGEKLAGYQATVAK